ncbi:biotin--[acetyl-CoA-carboxylase] ligase [Tepidibacillus fermentans]|uniref:Bifunctional ligase/repressor BirA n=1 Tax=Tepidibacillus fermentans TaxID=1281767 RepID=A0A4R3KKY2_9BACI|nr:biotin--[acetyl-CoA-carboxylase] ligase [Tepidibacillus fermentans]TCS84160.1 BirA family biotin operon repressor/biotin-[acetyl-CoA-carboxylase] ligase [Tepidibacillus fermentans]
MREKIKEIFIQSRHQFVSGEEISKQLNISRTAVWKHIEELKKEGYQFEAIRKRGYRLLNDPDDISKERLKANLSTQWLGKEIIYFSEVDSTQRVAHELAKNGVPHGTVVITDEQTEGKGRLGRTWFSEKGKGIWMSFILRPSFAYHQALQITLFTSVVLANTLKKLYQRNFLIKWPNDIYINGKKVSGILTEMHGEQDQIHYMIIGIGINTHQITFPENLKEIATSIQQETGYIPKRIELIQHFFTEFEQDYSRFEGEGFMPFYKQYNDALYGKGRRIQLKQVNQQIEGTIMCIDSNGYLILQEDDGKEAKVVSGDIFF